MQGLRDRNGRTVQAGCKVLIDGASGNVGPFAVQIAKSMGAEVTGVCSTEKVDFVRSLGADHVIDYTTTDFTATGERYDWILDTDSHQSIVRSAGPCDRAAGTSRSAATGSTSSQGVDRRPAARRCSASRRAGLMLWWKPFDPADVATLTDLVAAGHVTPAIDRRYPLSETAEALRWVEEGRNKGKVVVIVVT